jgi:hypothetical protein
MIDRPSASNLAEDRARPARGSFERVAGRLVARSAAPEAFSSAVARCITAITERGCLRNGWR